jgi:hypothetical protein
MRIWDALSKTDPSHTKGFKRAGGFQGTAVKPIWTIKRMTEQFGPAGTGWGMDEPRFDVVNAGDEILVFCTVHLWYVEPAVGSKVAGVYGVGGDKVMGKNKYGAFTNDEAFKASYTDALSNAMKQIGVAADIHMGLFDDSKYRREIEQEFASGTAPFASNALEQARQDIIEQNGGETRSTYQIKHVDKSAGRMAAELWASQALGVLQTPGFDTLSFKDWKLQPCTNKGTKNNGQKLEELREKHPDLADKIDEAADALPLAAA